MERRPYDPEDVAILCLCTANRVRSPVAELLLRERLDDLGIAARVTSAGFLADGEPASTTLSELLRGRNGCHLDTHRSRTVTPCLIRGADLVLGMAREHIRHVVETVPEAWSRSFTLREIVRRGEAIGPRADAEPVSAWIARAHAGRAPSALVSWSRRADIRDPRNSLPAGAAMVGELEDLVGRLVALLWPRVGAPPGSRRA